MANIRLLANFAGQLLPIAHKNIRPQPMFDAVVIIGNIVLGLGVALMAFVEDLLVVIPQCQPQGNEADNRMAYINRYCEENMGNLANISDIVRFRRFGLSLAFLFQGLAFCIPLLYWKIKAAPKLKILLHNVKHTMTDMWISALEHRETEHTKSKKRCPTDLLSIIEKWQNENTVAKHVWKAYLATQTILLLVTLCCISSFLLLILIPVGYTGRTFWSGPATFECKIPNYNAYTCSMNDSYTTQAVFVINMNILILTAIACTTRLVLVNTRSDFKKSFLGQNLPEDNNLGGSNAKTSLLISEIMEFNSGYLDEYGYWLALKSHQESQDQQKGAGQPSDAKHSGAGSQSHDRQNEAGSQAHVQNDGTLRQSRDQRKDTRHQPVFHDVQMDRMHTGASAMPE